MKLKAYILFFFILIAWHSYAQTSNFLQGVEQNQIKKTTVADSISNQYSKGIRTKSDSLSRHLQSVQKTPERKIIKADSTFKKYNNAINKKADKAEKEEDDLQQLPDKYAKKMSSKIDQYNGRITKKTEKSLEKLSKYEDKIHSVLLKTSPQTAQRLFGNGQMTFSSLLQKLKNGEAITAKYQQQYDAYNDKLTSHLKYLEQQKNKLDSNMVKPVTDANKKMTELNKEEDQSAAIQEFIKERKKQLMTGTLQYLQNSKYLAGINKEAFYYEASLKNYKEIFDDPAKVEQTATGVLNKMPAFQKFFQQNSQLSSLFGNSTTSSNDNNSLTIAGLQTRAQVQGMIQQQITAGGPNAQAMLSQNIKQAQTQLSQLKDKVANAGGGSSDTNIPDFKPNMQKTKTFLQRLEYNSSIQFAKSNTWIPSTTDIALSVGYKINDKAIVGLGISYDMGMGTIHHINFSTQGVGIRSFIDCKLKKQLYITGGFEMNNFPVLDSISFPSDGHEVKVGAWQESALIGFTKKMSIKSKMFKATNVQLLYDLLCNQHIPRSQPILFRVGYNF